MKKSKMCLLLALTISSHSTAWADNVFRIVTDPWPPYAYLENNQAAGIDVDIALAVLDTMGIKGQIEMMPWKRSLTSVRNLDADAILSAAVTEVRKAFLYFPDEPISKGNTVFFMRNSENIEFNALKNLDSIKGLDSTKGLDNIKVGAMLGYKYCSELDNTHLLVTAERVATLDQSFQMLMNKRVDLVVSVDAVGLHKAQQMGIVNDIKVLKNLRFCTVENHLAFAKKEGYELIADKFSDALRQFKTTPAYRKILTKYATDSR